MSLVKIEATERGILIDSFVSVCVFVCVCRLRGGIERSLRLKGMTLSEEHKSWDAYRLTIDSYNSIHMGFYNVL